MAWPQTARLVSGVSKVTRIPWSLLNAIQDKIIGVFGGSLTLKALQVDGVGDAAATVGAGSITASGTITGTAQVQSGGTVLGAKLASSDATQGLELRSGTTVYCYQLVGSIQTTNATTTAVITVPVPTGKAIAVVARAVGLKNDASAGAYHIVAAGRRNDAGAVSTIGSDQNIITAQQDAGWGGVSVVTSGTNALVRVTGAVGTTVNWGVFVDVTVSS